MSQAGAGGGPTAAPGPGTGPGPGPGAVPGAGTPPGRAGEPDQRWSRVSGALWRRPWARATLLLTPALAWFVLIYLAALAILLVTAFWRINPFTTNIERVWNIDNFTLIFGNAAYRGIVLRTVGMAAGVTVVDAIIAFPFAYYMARIASARTRTLLYVAILLPLWASYLARVYAWLLIFTHDGLLNWTLGKLGAGSVSLIYTNWAVFTVFCYLWLPFMIIPVYAALERIPASQIEASQDLGARTWRTPPRDCGKRRCKVGVFDNRAGTVCTSAARTAYPSRVARGNGGKSRSASRSSASTNPTASSRPVNSGGVGDRVAACCSTARRASAKDSGWLAHDSVIETRSCGFYWTRPSRPNRDHVESMKKGRHAAALAPCFVLLTDSF